MTAPDSVQVINENKEFNHELSSYLDSTNTLNSGLDYHIVSVFGSQSTGKSTLLNALFGTKFTVMNEASRSQTTKGIWMGKAVMNEPEAISDSDDSNDSNYSNISEESKVKVSKASDKFLNISKPSNILVLDVEGTDGRERGEDQDFERRSALFALATSEVLIVNMWENQVGLYQGANMGLLKTVFEVNLSLFQTSGKTSKSMILFVIRDHLGTTPLENLSQTLLQDLNKHWESISKPTDELKMSKIDDFFDIQFFTLPHKVLLPDKFNEQISILSHRFTNSTSSSYIFKPEYHRKVPIDGWNLYADQIWQQIELNKDLDLPTQQMLVARFRCEEISNTSWEYFEENLNKLNQEKGGKLGGKKVIDNFGTCLKTIRNESLNQYDSLASRYQESVYQTKRKDLKSKIDTKLLNLFAAQLKAIHEAGLELFTSTVNKETTNNIGEVIEKAKLIAQEYFEKGAKEASTIDEEVFIYNEEENNFNNELQSLEDKKKQDEISKIIKKLSKRISRIFSEELDSFFATPDEDTWRKVADYFNATLRTILFPYSDGKDFKVGATIEHNNQGAHEIRKQAWISLDSKLREITKDDNVIMRLRENFEKSFRYDKNDIPIIWKPTDDIETPYLKARDEALNLLPIFAQATLPDGDKFEPDVIIDEDNDIGDFSSRISDHRLSEIATKFKRQADALYVDAKRSTTQSTTHIPFYFIVLLIVLGWNEFMAVLRNPFLIFILILAISGGYITYTLDMWGPILTVTTVMFDKSFDIAKERLRQALEVPQHYPNSETTIPLDDLKPSEDKSEDDSSN